MSVSIPAGSLAAEFVASKKMVSQPSIARFKAHLRAEPSVGNLEIVNFALAGIDRSGDSHGINDRLFCSGLQAFGFIVFRSVKDAQTVAQRQEARFA